MIELTKKQFDQLLTNIETSEPGIFSPLTRDEVISRMVICKYLIPTVFQYDSIINGYPPASASVKEYPVYLYKLNGYSFNDNPTQIDYINGMSTPTHTGLQVNIQTSSLEFNPQDLVNNGILTPSDVKDGFYECVLIYFNLNVQTELNVFNFFETNIKSIDYIGNYYKNLNLNGTAPYLEEINLSNNNASLFENYGYYNNHSSLDTEIYNGNIKNLEFTLSPKAFSGSPIKKMVFPNASENYIIPEGCFEGCSELQEVVLSDSVVGIGNNAFKNCTNLRYIYIPNTVQTIGSGAFEGCNHYQLVFDVSYTNLNFIGEHGALLRRKTDKTYSVIHATTAWNPEDWTGQEHHYVCNVNDLPSYITFTPTPNQIITPGYVITSQGNDTFVDIYGNSFTGELVNPQFYETQGFNNGTGVKNQADGISGILIFATPVYKLITEFEERSCVKANHGFRFELWDSLQTIGKEAFKDSVVGTPFICSPYYTFKQATIDYGPTPETTTSYTIHTKSFFQNMSIGESAFENCNFRDQGSFYLTKQTTFGRKAFFGSTIQIIDFNGTSDILDPLVDIGELCFGNTPDLKTITDSGLQNSPTIKENAILAAQNNRNGIYVGCKNTSISNLVGNHNVTAVLNYAFYGCSSYAGTTNDRQSIGQLYSIGEYAFYGCVSLVSSQISPIPFMDNCHIGGKSFYGCSSITYFTTSTSGGMMYEITIGELAFANSAISDIYLNYNIIPILADDAFENCPLKNIYVNDNGFIDTIVVDSDVYVTNAIMKYRNDHSITLIKSGDGKDIVNTEWITTNIVSIANDAFSGSNMNDGSNTTIQIPGSVKEIGSNIFNGSTTDGILDGDPSNPCDLKLNGDIVEYSDCIWNDPSNNSEGLLFYVGGKYFQKIVDDTADYFGQYHYYTFDYDNNSHTIHIDAGMYGINSVVIGDIFYNENHDIILRMYYRLDWDYMMQDTNLHITELDNEIDLVLMYGGQHFTPDEENVYCNIETGPGAEWHGYTIPDDISRDTFYGYEIYDSASPSAFANCKWVNNVKTSKLLNNIQDAFKGCTNLLTISANDYDNESNLSYTIYNGIIPKGAFEGCTKFLGITYASYGNKVFYPIEYNSNAFKGCTSYCPESIIQYGNVFGDGSFENTGLTDINLCSVISIGEGAFKGCSMSSSKADSICGYYFTGDDDASVVDNRNYIIVGSMSSDINSANGIDNFAFYGLDLSGNNSGVLAISNKSGYNIGAEAFSESTITQYQEIGCDSTYIGIGAFKNCQSLNTISIPSNGLRLSESTFENCIALSSVTLAECDIPKESFKGCTSLQSFTVSGKVDSNAFDGCISLETITFNYYEEAVQTINPTAFIGCPLEHIYYTNQNRIYKFGLNGNVYTYDEKGHLKLLIGSRNYDSLYNKFEITIDGDTIVYEGEPQVQQPVNVKTIGQHAYNGRGLTGDITIPGSVTTIENYAFANNPGITKVYIPTTVEYIGNHAFDGCTNLARITIPDSCQFIGEGALKGCALTEGVNCNTFDDRYYSYNPVQSSAIAGTTVTTYLKSSLDLRNSTWISGLSNEAFANTQIQVVKLPKSCTSIGTYAFYGCTKLTEIHLYLNENDPAKFYIYDYAFYGCQSLGDIYLWTNKVPELNGNNVIYGMGSSVPEGHRHLHILNGYEPYVVNTEFYGKLHGLAGFDIVDDLLI